MANTLLTPSVIAREALMVLRNNMVMAPLVHRDHSREFVAKVGDTVSIRKPATFEAKEFNQNSGIEVQNATETSISVALDKHLDVSFEVTSKEMTLSIQDFSAQLLVPAMQAFAQKVDSYLVSLYKDIPYYYGSAGSTPNSLAAIAGVRKVLNDNAVPLQDRRLVMDTAAEAALIALEAFNNASYVGDAGTALREASMGRKMGFDLFMDQNVALHTKGTLTASAPKATGSAGSDTITIADTTLTGTVVAGDILVIANKPYTVTTGGTATSNAISNVKIYPNVPTGGFSSAAITHVANHTPNLAFHKNAFALVTRPLAIPNGVAPNQVAVVEYEGFGLRVIYAYDSKYKKDVVSIDMLCGTKTLQPELAARLIG